jgi:hypothetical protein
MKKEKTDRKGSIYVKKYYSLFGILVAVVLIIAGAGCRSKDKGGPKELLDKYFSSAIKQDYASTYACYYAPYKAKVSKEEYLKHRKEAAVLQAYNINFVKRDGDNAAQAEVQLTFAPSEKLNRKEPVTTTVKEDLIKEGGEWKIKVW